jgi:hypothetical protein
LNAEEKKKRRGKWEMNENNCHSIFRFHSRAAKSPNLSILVPISGLFQPYPLITLLSRRKFLQTKLVPTASTWDKPGRPNHIAEDGQFGKQFTFGRSKCNPLRFQLESGVLLMSPDIRIFQGIDSGLMATK